MITLHPITAGAGVKYLTDSVMRADAQSADRGMSMQQYLAQHGDAPGEWLGRGAGLLELSGEVTDAQAEAIFQLGADPRTGELLGRRFPTYPTADELYERLLKAEPDASPERREALRAQADAKGNNSAKSGWEMVISPVKSFSVAWGLADDAGREALAAAEKRAAAAVVERLENEVAWTRIGAGGAAQVKAEGIIAGWFLHRSSRAGDPTFHRHLVVSARVPYRDETGRVRWLSLDSPPLHRMTVALSEFYTAALEREMAQLGYLAAPRAESVAGKRPVREYVGVPAAALTMFSSRRQGTERAYEKLLADFIAREHREPSRAESYKLYQAAALVGRPDKELHSLGAERAEWRRRAAAEGGIARPEQLGDAMRQASLSLAGQAARVGDWREQVPAQVLAELRSRHVSWRRSNIEAEAVRQLVACGAHLQPGELEAMLGEVVDAVLADGDTVTLTRPELVPAPAAYRRADGESVFRATNSTLFTSARLIEAERSLVDAALNPAGLALLPAARVDRALAAGDASRGFSPSDQQREVVRAVFGTDRLLSAVIGRAGTGKTTVMQMVREVAAANGTAVLGLSAGQVQADTLEAESGIRSENIARWLHRSQLSSVGHPDWTLRPGTLVIVDEAGQAGTAELAALLAQVRDAGGGARMLLVGDHLQAGAVAAGGILAELEAREAPVSTLTEVKRFRSHTGQLREWESEASLMLAAGDPASLDRYAARNRIHAGPPEAMAEAAYTAYVNDTALGLASVLIAPDNATADALSARVREARILAGLVDADGPSAELAGGARAAVGDVVATRRNNREMPVAGGRGYVRNGDTWTVTAVREDGSLQVRDRISGAVAELSADYTGKWVQLGYALTGYRAQGLTVDTAHALIRAGMTRNSLYPSMTRGRYQNHAYIELSEPLDHETGEPGYPTTARHVWRQVIERDGTDQAATAQGREAVREAGALSGLYLRARYVLADLGTARIEHLARQVLGDAANPVIAADAWPALAELLRVLEAQDQDPGQILAAAHAARSMTGAIDQAAVLHARIVSDPECARLVAEHTIAETEVAGPGLLHLLGIAPSPFVDGEKAKFARELGDAFLTRAAEITAQAEGEAWTRVLYGPVPDDIDAATARAARIQAAALYRSLTDRTSAADPLGPPPPAHNYGLRVLWRRAQPEPDRADLRARAVNAVFERLDWARDLGRIPAEQDLYQAWGQMAAAVVEYRDRWGIDTHASLLGEPVTDRVQAADRHLAERAVARWNTLAAGVPDALRRPGPAPAEADSAVDKMRAEIYHQRGIITLQRQILEDISNTLAAARAKGDRATAANLVSLGGERAKAQAAGRRALARIKVLEAQLALGAGDPWEGRPYGHFTDQKLTATLTAAENRAAQAERLRTEIERIQSGEAAERYAAEKLASAAERVPTILALQAAREPVHAAELAKSQAEAKATAQANRAEYLRERAKGEKRADRKITLKAAGDCDTAATAAKQAAEAAEQRRVAALPALRAAEAAEARSAATTPDVTAERWLEIHNDPDRVRREAEETFTGVLFGKMTELGPIEAIVDREAAGLDRLRAERDLRAALPPEQLVREDAVRKAQADAAKAEKAAQRGRGPKRPGPGQDPDLDPSQRQAQIRTRHVSHTTTYQQQQQQQHGRGHGIG